MRFKDSKQYAAAQKWRKTHPEHIRALGRAAYYRKHPDAKTIAQVVNDKEAKALRTEKPCKRCGLIKPLTDFTPNKRTADGRQYQCRECIQKTAREHYRRNPAKAMQPVKRWQNSHGAELRHQAHKRRARKRQLPGSHTLKDWQDLCRSFHGRCVRCGVKGKLTRDHVIPITDKRSSNDISNIQPLCYSCNSSKGNRHSADYRMTPFINQGQFPLFV